MKRIIILLTLIVSMYFTVTQANYFDDNKNFIATGSSMESKTYIDINSVQVTRYSPPYYIIQANTYFFNYKDSIITKQIEQYFYDYDTKQIKMLILGMYRCDESGNVSKGMMFPIENRPYINLPTNSVGYISASLAFYKAYRIIFADPHSTNNPNRNPNHPEWYPPGATV